MSRPNLFRTLALAGALWPTLPLLAQDSIAPPGPDGLPGDALDAYRTSGPSEQVNDYVIDLAPFTSSWGGRYAIGPIVKSSRSASAASANHFIAAQFLAPTLLDMPRAHPEYSLWNSAGAGVNDQVNSAPGIFAPIGHLGQRSALAFVEFGAGHDMTFGTGDDEQNTVATLIDFQFRRPNRLLVSRIVAAHNRPNTPGNTSTASFGLGAIDHAGNIAISADGFGCVSSSRLTARNYFLIAADSRDPARTNRIQQSGPLDLLASTRILESTTPLCPPSLIPASIAGRAVLLGTAFNADYVYEATTGLTLATRTYLPSPLGSPRGSVSFIPTPFAPVSIGGVNAGCAAVITRLPGDTRTRGISIFGLNTNGSVDAQLRVLLPTTPGQLVDPVDPFDPTLHFPSLSDYDFTNIQSQAAFRGGPQVAGAVLPGGDLFLAATINFAVPGASGASVPQGEHNAIVVARVPHAGGSASWTLAAHTGDIGGAAGGLSKPIRGDFGADGVPGTGDAGEGDGVLDKTAVGRLALSSEVDSLAASGPSISSPAMDADANLYFLACVRLNTPAGAIFTYALLRANLDIGVPGGYSLELLAREGQVIAGHNSTRSYKITSLALADADSIDSGAVWAGNVSRGRVAGAQGTPLPPGSPLSLGLLAVRAKIVYDVNTDGLFVDPEITKAPSPDQSNNVVLAIMPRIPAADFNRDAAVTSQDFFDFLAALFTPGGGSAGADYNGTGAADSQDFFDYLNDFFGG